MENQSVLSQAQPITIAEDIPEAQYDFRPAPDSRSVRETLLHIASKMLFDLLGWTPRLRQPNKTLFAVRCKLLDRQDHCTAF